MRRRMMGATWVTKGVHVLQIPALRDWQEVANIPYPASPIGRQVSQFMACHLLSQKTWCCWEDLTSLQPCLFSSNLEYIIHMLFEC